MTAVRIRLVVPAILMFALAGCGGSDSQSQSPDQKQRDAMQDAMWQRMKGGMKGADPIMGDKMKDMTDMSKKKGAAAPDGTAPKPDK